MKIGELVLFPTVRKQAAEVIIAAAGTSCRHQIKDGTGRKSMHPMEILWEALILAPPNQIKINLIFYQSSTGSEVAQSVWILTQ
jgi:hypothetical protein